MHVYNRSGINVASLIPIYHVVFIFIVTSLIINYFDSNIYSLIILNIIIVVSFLVVSNKSSLLMSLKTLFLFIVSYQLLYSIISDNLDVNTIKILVGQKEIIVSFLLISLLSRYKLKLTLFDTPILLLLTIYLVSFVVSSGSAAAKVASLKEWLIISFIFLVGRFVGQNIKTNAIDKWINFIVLSSLIVSILSIIGYIFITEKTWIDLGVTQYFTLKYSDSNFSYLFDANTIPGNFYTYIFDHLIPRAVFPVLDAPALSRLYVFSAVFLVFTFRMANNKISVSKVVMMLFIFFAMVLTLGRSGFVMFFLSGTILSIYLKKMQFFFVITMIFVTLSFIYLIAIGDPNTQTHLNGLVKGFAKINTLFGNGLGSSGQAAITYGNTGQTMAEAVHESYVGALIYQTGAIGAVSFILIITSCIILIRKITKIKNKKLSLFMGVSISTFISLLVSSVFGSSAFSMISSYTIVISYGITVSLMRKMRVISTIRFRRI